MEAVGATRSSASAQLSLAVVRDGSGAAKAPSVAATGSTILLSRNHCTITVLIARRAKRMVCGARRGTRAYLWLRASEWLRGGEKHGRT